MRRSRQVMSSMPRGVFAGFALAGVLPVVALAAPADEVARVRGTVVNEAGMPVGGADVELLCGEYRRRIQTTWAGGFVIEGVTPGECLATASKAGLTSAVASVLAVDGSGPPPVILTLASDRFVEQVTVTPSRGFTERVTRVPESVSIVSRDDLESRPYTLVGQALREQPGVLVQQTSSAQVSPIIRGFTGQSNLYLIDGVRLNTSTWRPGPSQYFAWVDGYAVDGLEVIRGSGSLQYGSDGLGGTVQVLSQRPALRGDGGWRAGGTIDLTAASADQQTAGRFSGVLESSRFSLQGSYAATSVGDLRAGGGGDTRSAVTRFLGLPARTDDGRLIGTGYDMRSGNASAVARLGTTGVLMASYLGQSISNSNRYDRLNGGDGLHRSGFDPQRLDFGYLRYQSGAVGPLDQWTATFSVNRQSDGRFEQARPTARLDRQTATTTALGYQLQGHRHWGGRHQVMAGVEVYDERITAARTLNEANGTITVTRPDVPDGTTYLTTGAFAQQVSEIARDRLWVRGGARYSRFSFRTPTNAQLGIIEEEVAADAVTFQGGLVLALTDGINLALNASRGFRAGNSADLGGVGLTGGGGFEVSPTRARGFGALIGSSVSTTAVSTGESVGSLRPEIADTYELGVKVHRGRVSGSLVFFDVEMRDTIQRRAMIVESNIVGTNIDGFVVVRQDSAGLVFIAEDSRPIVTRVNLDRARVFGVEAEAHVRLDRGLSATAWFSMANGEEENGDYLRRMPPPLGGARLRWTEAGSRGWLEAQVLFAGTQSRLNSGDFSDARIGARRTTAQIASYFNGTATDLGLVSGGRLLETNETLAQVQARVLGGQTAAPMFTTGEGFVNVGLRAGWRLSPALSVTVMGDNLFDRAYRFHSSGLDAPGRNVQVRIRYHLGSTVPRRP